MTAAPWQGRLLTLEEFAALPEDNSRRYELEEGILVVSPRPTKPHQRVIVRLAQVLNEQMSPKWEAFTELEVVVVDRNPGTVRVPDVVVAPPDGQGAQEAAADVLIAAEVISPWSRRKDTLVKPMEYAEAGIPYYWVIDLDPPASLTAYILVDGHYQAQTVTAEFVTVDPFPLRIDIPELVTPRGATEG